MNKRFFMSLFAAAALTMGFTSCSNDDAVGSGNAGISDGSPRYVTVNLVNSDGAITRGDQYNDAPDALYEDGEAKENAVTNAIFFFFTDNGGAKTVTGNKVSNALTGKNYLNVEEFSELGPNHAQTVEQILSTTLVIQAEQGTTLPTKMAAVLNVPLATFTKNTYSLEELNAIVADYKTNHHTDAGTFIITSSVWSASDSSIEEIGTANVVAYGAKEQAIANPTKIYVERALAKVRVKLADGISSGAAGASATVKKDGVTYVSTGQKIKLDPADNTSEVEIYAKFDNWYVASESNMSYLIKNLSNLKNATGLWTNWTYPDFHRSFWAYTPIDHAGFDYLYHAWNPATAKGYTAGSNEYYTQENTFARYEPNTTTNTKLNKDAKVVIAAELGYFDASNNWTALTIGMFGQEKYPITATNDYLLNAALKYLTDQGQLDYWYFEDSQWKQIDKSFFTYQGISQYTNPTTYGDGTDVTKLVDIARYECRIILNETAADTKGQWYTKLANDENDATKKAAPADQPATSQVTLATIKGDLADNLPNVKKWTEGKSYYFFPIRHLGNLTNEGEPGRGYYGVVRNHIYDCTISTLAGLGTPVFNPGEYIIPEKIVEDTDTYVAAQINILSWRVVSQTVNLQ